MSTLTANAGGASIGDGAARQMAKSNLEIFAQTVEELVAEDSGLLVATSDSRGSGKLAPFASRHPDRMVEVGIAEQNLVAMAAGLVAGGRNAIAVSPASFLTTRALEQIKHDVCYSDRPVTLVGISAGVSYGALGSTHHSLHDFAALRAIHNITVVAPADNWEAREAVRAAVLGGGDAGRGPATLGGVGNAGRTPVYIRFGKVPLPDLPHAAPLSDAFAFGKGRVLSEGTAGVFIATGETVWRAMEAAALLGSEGLAVGVVSMHTVKPLDDELVRSLAGRVGAVVTVEEHSENGGLGDACARVILEAGYSPRFRPVGLPDVDTVTGSQGEILEHYGISGTGLAGTMKNLLEA